MSLYRAFYYPDDEDIIPVNPFSVILEGDVFRGVKTRLSEEYVDKEIRGEWKDYRRYLINGALVDAGYSWLNFLHDSREGLDFILEHFGLPIPEERRSVQEVD